MKIPNFFIIGAPKCGTTSMSEYLRSHPNIYFSTPKEPYYFCRDIIKPLPHSVQTEGQYLTLFAKADKCHQAIGEGSVYYLYSNEAVQKIRSFNPEARLIVMVRDPIDMLHSLFHQNIVNGTENAPDFPTAWKWQEDRLRGEKLRIFCTASFE
jgi:hypothetical protein